MFRTESTIFGILCGQAVADYFEVLDEQTPDRFWMGTHSYTLTKCLENTSIVTTVWLGLLEQRSFKLPEDLYR